MGAEGEKLPRGVGEVGGAIGLHLVRPSRPWCGKRPHISGLKVRSPIPIDLFTKCIPRWTQ